MTRSKLIKAMMLGLCLSAFSTGIAFAQVNTTKTSTEPAAVSSSQSPELEALYAKQAEIDQYIFTDHAKDIETKGIFVSYTSINGDVIEIGITPFNDENANFFYNIFGEDQIKVVEFDQSVIYETTVAMTGSGVAAAGTATDEVVTADAGSVTEDVVTADAVPLKGEATTPDAALDDEKAPEAAADGKVYKEADSEMSIQIESTDAVPDDTDTIYYTTAEASSATEVKTVSANENLDDVKRGAESEKDGVSAPMIILIIAAGAAIVGGTVVVSGKKKTSR